MSADSPARITVSEDRLRALFAEFKLELFGELRKYATQASVDSLALAVRTNDIRIQSLEDKRVTREELHAVRGDISALKLWQAGLSAITSLKRWQITAAFAGLTLFSGLIASAITFYWLHHG